MTEFRMSLDDVKNLYAEGLAAGIEIGRRLSSPTSLPICAGCSGGISQDEELLRGPDGLLRHRTCAERKAQSVLLHSINMKDGQCRCSCGAEFLDPERAKRHAAGLPA